MIEFSFGHLEPAARRKHYRGFPSPLTCGIRGENWGLCCTFSVLKIEYGSPPPQDA